MDGQIVVSNVEVTPLRSAASYEPRIAILGIWGDTWLTCGTYGIFYDSTCQLRVPYKGLHGHFLPRYLQPYLLPCILRGGNEDNHALVLRNSLQ